MGCYPAIRASRRVLIAALLLGVSITAAQAEQAVAIVDNFPGAEFETTTPEAAGWSADKLGEAKTRSQKVAPTAAVMIVQHGRIVAEWGETAVKSNLHSARKSLLSALIGIAVDEHKIDPAVSIGSLGIDDNEPRLTDTEKTATVADLLKARSGVYHAALYETPGMARRRPPRGSHPPGTFWYYNNWDFNTLGTIYEQATGTGIYDALDRLIAQPIGMQDYRPQDGVYFPGAASDHRAYPLRMSARDLARFALLYLNKGAWAGKQIVPADWVRESTRPYSVQPSSGFGYGYLWWTAPATPGPDGIPEGTFMAWGAGGQHAFVVPACDLVVVNRVDRDLRLPEPKLSEVKQLLNLALKAGPFGR